MKRAFSLAAISMVLSLASLSASASDLNIACMTVDASLKGNFQLTIKDLGSNRARQSVAEMINFKEGGIKMTTQDGVHILLLENIGAGESSTCRMHSYAFLENALLTDTDGFNQFVFVDNVRHIQLEFQRR